MLDPFGRSRPPPEFAAGIIDPERARRVRLLAECFAALLAGKLPSLESRLFVSAGGMAWLEHGGSLDKDHWRVRAPYGSHHGPAYMWRLMRDADGSSRGEIGSHETDTFASEDNSEGTL